MQKNNARSLHLVLLKLAVLPGRLHLHFELNGAGVELDQDLGLFRGKWHTHGRDSDGRAQHHGAIVHLHDHTQLAQRVEHRHGEVQHTRLQHDLLSGDGTSLGEIRSSVVLEILQHFVLFPVGEQQTNTSLKFLL